MSKEEKEKKRVVKLLSQDEIQKIDEINREADQQRIQRDALLSEQRIKNVVDYDSLPKPKEITEISDINEMLK
jgi:hypothetical protein